MTASDHGAGRPEPTTVVRTDRAPRPAGPYSQAVRAGDLLFVSGQVPREPDGSYIPRDVHAETVRTLENLAAVAAAAGASLAQCVKVTAYLADGADLAEFNRACADFFRESPPARTTVVAGLREVKVEMDAVLHLGTP